MMKTLAVLLLTLFTGSAYAATSAEPAHTGVALDVAKTLSITDTSNACGVVPVEWVYEDSHGERHVATYSVLGNGCAGG